MPKAIFAVLYVLFMGLTRCYKTTVFLHLFTYVPTPAKTTSHHPITLGGEVIKLMAVLCGMPTMQYSARRALLSMHKLFISSIWCDSIVDGNWRLRLIDVIVICRVVNPVERCRKFGKVPCMGRTGQGNDFELIPIVGKKTKNPVVGYFDKEFPVTCNHCGVMAAWSLNTLKF